MFVSTLSYLSLWRSWHCGLDLPPLSGGHSLAGTVPRLTSYFEVYGPGTFNRVISPFESYGVIDLPPLSGSHSQAGTVTFLV